MRILRFGQVLLINPLYTSHNLKPVLYMEAFIVLKANFNLTPMKAAFCPILKIRKTNSDIHAFIVIVLLFSDPLKLLLCFYHKFASLSYQHNFHYFEGRLA